MLTDSERAAIERHHDWMIATAGAALAKLRTVPTAARNGTIDGLIDYWRHSLRFAKWSRTFIGKELKAGATNNAVQIQQPNRQLAGGTGYIDSTANVGGDKHRPNNTADT